MRAPPAILVVDASILVAAVRGRTADAIEEVQSAAMLVTTERAVEEARRRIALGLKRPELVPVLEALAELIVTVPASELEPLLAPGEEAMKDAVASRNGSTRDAHLLALAWKTGGEIWSSDRDFAETGVASWSTANLLRAVAEAGDSSQAR